MIAPQDLRLGNWITTILSNEPLQVTSIKQNPAKDGFVYSINTLYLPDHCYGIQISPELLERCGFVKDGFDTYNIPLVCNLIATEKTYHLSFSGDYLYIRQGRGGGSLDDMVTVWNKDIMRVFYLHQLQNIVHALTNTELTITI